MGENLVHTFLSVQTFPWLDLSDSNLICIYLRARATQYMCIWKGQRSRSNPK